MYMTVDMDRISCVLNQGIVMTLFNYVELASQNNFWLAAMVCYGIVKSKCIEEVAKCQRELIMKKPLLQLLNISLLKYERIDLNLHGFTDSDWGGSVKDIKN